MSSPFERGRDRSANRAYKTRRNSECSGQTHPSISNYKPSACGTRSSWGTKVHDELECTFILALYSNGRPNYRQWVEPKKYDPIIRLSEGAKDEGKEGPQWPASPFRKKVSRSVRGQGLEEEPECPFSLWCLQIQSSIPLEYELLNRII